MKPQEMEGSYFFSGKFLVTQGIQALLTPQEIASIYLEVQKLVKENDGIDYLVVYVHEDTGQKLFFIDQLNKEMIASGDFLPEYNYCTLLLAEEYWWTAEMVYLELSVPFFKNKLIILPETIKPNITILCIRFCKWIVELYLRFY